MAGETYPKSQEQRVAKAWQRVDALLPANFQESQHTGWLNVNPLLTQVFENDRLPRPRGNLAQNLIARALGRKPEGYIREHREASLGSMAETQLYRPTSGIPHTAGMKFSHRLFASETVYSPIDSVDGNTAKIRAAVVAFFTTKYFDQWDGMDKYGGFRFRFLDAPDYADKWNHMPGMRLEPFGPGSYGYEDPSGTQEFLRAHRLHQPRNTIETIALMDLCIEQAQQGL